MTRIVKKPEERRQEIVRLTQRLFLQNGYESTSLNQVVDILGVAKGTVYHYFKSKEELLEAVVTDMAESYLQAVQEKVTSADGNAVERLKEFVEAIDVESAEKETLEQLHRSENLGLHVRLLAQVMRGLAPRL